MYQHVLVDCGHMVETAAKEALECSDQIVIVLTLSLPAIRRSKRLLDGLCARQLPPGRIVVLVNRYTKDQKELLEETQEILGLAISGAIPNDYDTAHDAINQGNPLALMAPKTCLAQWFLRSHTLIDGSPGVHDTTTTGKEEKSASFLGRYLASFRHEARERPSQI
jgi:Flp pilus assembly CpaE family ATPase